MTTQATMVDLYTLRKLSSNIDILCMKLDMLAKGKSTVKVRVTCKTCGAHYVAWDLCMLESWTLQGGMTYKCKGLYRGARCGATCNEVLTYNPLSKKEFRKALRDLYKFRSTI